MKNVTDLMARTKLLFGLSLSPRTRAHLILVLFAKKPATEFQVYFDCPRIEGIAYQIRQAGLACATKAERFEDGFITEEGKTYSYEFINVWVAKDQATLAELMNVEAEADENSRHKAWGRLFGYPESAVRAFVGEEGFSRKDLKSFRRYIPAEYDFLTQQLIFSNEAWKQELECVKRWHSLIVEVAPQLIREHQVLQQHPDLFDRLYDDRITITIH